ncbi:hypothetical protein [Halothiobacillus sp. 15-55-196]|uniref:hypothetical protein n=1 Tax=Halothiobacillus sp. 15-55-196 TaxID=1970382 RepID=UPI0025BEC4A5|nr:hypothetical protein [Halothiobacillus sp. 15-55-196]
MLQRRGHLLRGCLPRGRNTRLIRDRSSRLIYVRRLYVGCNLRTPGNALSLCVLALILDGTGHHLGEPLLFSGRIRHAA